METKKNTMRKANFHLELMDLGNDNPPFEWKESLNPKQMKRWERGEAALAVAPPKIESEKMFVRFVAVAKACQKWRAGPEPASDEFIKSLQELDKCQKEGLMLALFPVERNRDQWAKLLNVTGAQLAYIAYHTFKPLLKFYGEKVSAQVSISHWLKNYCPVCGDQPTMAKLSGQDGHRKLYCGRCETHWRYKRSGCPYCNEDDSEASFFTLDDNRQYRVYLCDHCKSYLKTVDERECGEVDLFCEDILTVELDELAHNEGYQRGGTEHYG
ncbi:formate dehydrogenase accessory protein FdhE [Desulforamulus ruminis]|uniref:Formate dehydrogenase accessory protein n=1 Tax=Desulforamulus ruminis (strain ATCC 23193 / DSM 2154 / NCIMB 8452 / DL) TaxID=696281 RepID=F6DQZ2_DESRL|nr:formate dehydrogenase accessory protein FdhE [Desulforamulus ruminis]AEG58716.1 formate dehydrogenase accessory protein [Desulforamulus ruminis DSM 2154]